jgi:hypothetical protein
MFESITITRSASRPAGQRIDFGFLLECLLFYKQVHLVVNDDGIPQLVQAFGLDLLTELVEDGVLVVHYEHDHMGIQTHRASGKEWHAPIAFWVEGRSVTRALHKASRLTGLKGAKVTQACNRLIAKVQTLKRDKDLLEAASLRLSDQNFLEEAVPLALRKHFPTYDKPVRFKATREAEGFIIETDIPFGFLNAVRKAFQHEEVGPALLLDEICRVEDDMNLAAAHLSEIATDGLGNHLLKLRFSQLARRLEKSDDVRSQFVELAIGEAKSLRHALDFDPASMRKIVDAILAAKKFKDWLVAQPPNTDVIREYVRSVTEPSIFDKLPSKSVRWAIFQGLGLVADATFAGGLGTASGMAIGAIDSFLIDQVFNRWKPNQFVDDHLRPLLVGKE